MQTLEFIHKLINQQSHYIILAKAIFYLYILARNGVQEALLKV